MSIARTSIGHVFSSVDVLFSSPQGPGLRAGIPDPVSAGAFLPIDWTVVCVAATSVSVEA